MGKGIAKQCADRYPDSTEFYKAACRTGDQAPGKLAAYQVKDGPILCFFPTKRHWRDDSRLEDITLGLEELKRRMDRKPEYTVAIPPIGCGLGRLDKKDVLAEIDRIIGIWSVTLVGDWS